MRLPFQRKNQPAAARDSPKPLRSDAFLLEAMDAWGDVVYRVALAQTGSPSDADDVFQDVFMRLLENDTAFESDEHLKAWLLRVTVNRCRDLARLTWNRRTEGFTREHADIPAPDAFDADIWEVVGALPPDLRIPVHLFYVEGYATEEIARITGCRPSTVRPRLHRARQQLRSMLEDDRGQRESSLASCRDPLCRKEPNRDRSPQPRPTPNRG